MTASLLDIAPLRETVDVLGKKVEVRGISGRDLVSLLGRFPDLQKLLAGRDLPDGAWAGFAPDAIAAIIAAAIGKAGNPKEEAAADALPVEVQVDLMSAIMRLTMPRGIGPFVEKLTSALGVSPGDSPAPGPDITSPAQSKN